MPEDSRFLAFAKCTSDKMQLAKVLCLADMSLKSRAGAKDRVVSIFQRRLIEDLNSPIFMPKSFSANVRVLFDD